MLRCGCVGEGEARGREACGEAVTASWREVLSLPGLQSPVFCVVASIQGAEARQTSAIPAAPYGGLRGPSHGGCGVQNAGETSLPWWPGLQGGR